MCSAGGAQRPTQPRQSCVRRWFDELSLGGADCAHGCSTKVMHLRHQHDGHGRVDQDPREQRGLSQRALAQRAGVEQSTIARIELGETDPAYSTVIRLLAAAGFRVPEPEPSIPDVGRGGKR